MIIQNLNNKTFISYSGGCGGDFFTNSCNGDNLSFRTTQTYVTNVQTIKRYEDQIIRDINKLPIFISKFSNRYISTHLLEPLVDSYDVINIILTHPEIIEMAATRQMAIQPLEIKINHKENWFKIVRAWCLAKKFEIAAKFWYEKANKLYKSNMEKRISYRNIPSVNFNSIFSDTFVKDLVKQGWKHNIDILIRNHKCWLKKKQEYTKADAIESMSKKLSVMDWKQENGIIKYVL